MGIFQARPSSLRVTRRLWCFVLLELFRPLILLSVRYILMRLNPEINTRRYTEDGQNGTVLTDPWEPDIFICSIPLWIRTTEGHHRSNRPPLEIFLRQYIPVQILSHCFSKISFNTTLPYKIPYQNSLFLWGFQFDVGWYGELFCPSSLGTRCTVWEPLSSQGRYATAGRTSDSLTELVLIDLFFRCFFIHRHKIL